MSPKEKYDEEKKVKINEEEMNCVYNSIYFSLNKKLQIYSGLWPYESRASKMFRRFVLYTILFLAFIPLGNGFRVWCGVDLDICSENIVGIIYTLTILLKFWLVTLSENKLKNIYQEVARNWLDTKDPTEHAILVDYARQGRMSTISYLVYMTLAGCGFCQIPMIPIIFDFVFPLNQSRQKMLFVKGEFIIDPYKHFYKLYIYFMLAAVMTVLAVTSIDTTYTVIVHQILGIFSIVKYRLHLATVSFHQEKDVGYEIIVKAIRLHKEALRFVDLIEKSYNIFFLILIGLTVLFISIGAIVLMVHVGAMLDLCRLMMVVFGAVVHILYLSLPGQMIIDHSCDLFVSMYATEWYNISERSKRLFKLIMLRCIKPCVMTAGGLYVMNLENFGSIMKSAMSYITVVASFR